MKITSEEWEAKGRELFGPNKDEWKIQCPTCSYVCSVSIARVRHPEVKGKGWNPAQECIGRYVKDAGCDWCAYGLFSGPLFVAFAAEDKTVPCFDFQGLPFTGAKTGPCPPPTTP